MLSSQELEKIRNKLEASQNPLFFYDNDCDGLCSFLILKRSLGRGKGVVIKSFPELKELYYKRVEELNPDLIVILDKAELDPAFAEKAEINNIPILWIDHHESKTPKETIQKTSYFNPVYQQNDLAAKQPNNENDLVPPTSYIAQKIFNRPEDIWISLTGCIADVYMPDFAESFSKKYPELLPPNIDAFESLQTTTIGKIARKLNFGLMDTTTSILRLIRYMSKATSPYDILEENESTKQFHLRSNQLEDFLKKQIEKAHKNYNEKTKILFFTYSGNTSMSSEISNRLAYEYPNSLIIVAYLRPEKANISIRGENALEITKKLIDGIEGATGGGHSEATGAMVPILDFEKFKANIAKLTK